MRQDEADLGERQDLLATEERARWVGTSHDREFRWLAVVTDFRLRGFQPFSVTRAQLIVGLRYDPVSVSWQLGHSKASFTQDTYSHPFDRVRRADEMRTAKEGRCEHLLAVSKMSTSARNRAKAESPGNGSSSGFRRSDERGCNGPRVVAMQKVEGSDPFIRSIESPA